MYCAYDSLNPTVNRETGVEEHCCEKFGSIHCLKCPSSYDGDKIKKYMENNPKEH